MYTILKLHEESISSNNDNLIVKDPEVVQLHCKQTKLSSLFQKQLLVFIYDSRESLKIICWAS